MTTANGQTASRKIVIIGKRFSNDVNTYNIAFIGDDGRKAIVEIDFKARDGKIYTAKFQLANISYNHESFIVGMWRSVFLSATKKIDSRIKAKLPGHENGVTHWLYPKNNIKK